MNMLEFLGTETDDDGVRRLPFASHTLNPFGSIHASAQFAFAEISAGEFLGDTFPEYRKKTSALLRRSQVKYRKPGMSSLTAQVSLAEGAGDSFLEKLNGRGRATITIDVRLIDESGDETFAGSFEWHVALLAAESAAPGA